MQLNHRPAGYPTWYGHPKGEPSRLTTHSVTYGYFWLLGAVDGTMTVRGKTIKVAGKGVRERYIAADTAGGDRWLGETLCGLVLTSCTAPRTSSSVPEGHVILLRRRRQAGTIRASNLRSSTVTGYI